VTRRYWSVSLDTVGQASGPGAGCGAACTLASTWAIRSVFHASRCNCHPPRATKPANSNAAPKPAQNRVGDRRGAFGPWALMAISRACPQEDIWLISWVAGIMLVFRWYITHSEPDRAMTTTMIVKIRASMVQPPSDLEFMCRK
jgi:hypothetical protein